MRKKILRYGIRIVLLGILGIFAFYWLVRFGAFGHVPDEDELRSIRNSLASEVYSEEGTLIGKYYIENRTGAGLNEIPEYLVQALIATEDARFYEHDGVDSRSLMRVLVKSLLMGDGSSGGGSTITQQLAKNLFGRPDLGILSMPVAKVREYIIAKKLEEVYSKDQILTLYLNTVSFGENIYGIETASMRYFNVKTDKLTIEEAAVLVGLLKANSLYNPRKNPEKATERRNVVLGQMAKYGYISEIEKDSLQERPLKIDYYNLEDEKPAPYLIASLKNELTTIFKELKKPDGTEYSLEKDGLIIETTINASMQTFATEAVMKHMERLQKEFDTHWKNSNLWGKRQDIITTQMHLTGIYKSLKAEGLSEEDIIKKMSEPKSMRIFAYNEEHSQKVEMSSIDSIKYYQALLHCGIVSIDPRNGAIKAWVGGIDFQHIPYDHVTTLRSAASTFKPFVFGAALENGFQPCDYFDNELKTYEEYNNWTPENAEKEYGGKYSMQGALKHSLNVIAVDVQFQVGRDKIKRFANKLGIETELQSLPSMALGANEVTLLEMTRAYAPFANGGYKVQPYAVKRITDQMGQVLFERSEPARKKVISDELAMEMNEMLQSVVNEGTGSAIKTMYKLNGEYAGKTGTAQNYSDGWFIGYTPGLVTGVWVGASSPQVHFRSGALGAGAHMALPIWAIYNGKVERSSLRNKFIRTFPEPSDSVAAMLNCPDYKDPGFFERLGDAIEDMTDSEKEGESKKSFWDKLFGRDPDDEK